MTVQTPDAVERTAQARRYLMCRPTYFDVRYEINAWMHAGAGVDSALAAAQWEDLRATYLRLGHVVEVVDGQPGQPDMVFAANAGTVVNGRAVVARFRNAERTGEEEPYRAWFAQRFDTHTPTFVNEGEGDFLWTGQVLLGASGFRSDPRAHDELARLLDVPVVPLELVSPFFYHLDTALTILAPDQIAYLPEAFSPTSQQVLREMFPHAIHASEKDARWFGLNATSDGRHVVVAAQAEGLHRQLERDGFVPVPVDLSEFRKSGGGIKCCTLELRD